MNTVMPVQYCLNTLTLWLYPGQYKCKARASFKTREEVISVKTVDAGPKKISFGVYEVKPKKNKANLVCEIKDPAFDADADVKFYWMDKGKQGALISGKLKAI